MAVAFVSEPSRTNSHASRAATSNVSSMRLVVSGERLAHGGPPRGWIRSRSASRWGMTIASNRMGAFRRRLPFTALAYARRPARLTADDLTKIYGFKGP